jgi:hypothetical protein
LKHSVWSFCKHFFKTVSHNRFNAVFFQNYKQ